MPRRSLKSNELVKRHSFRSSRKKLLTPTNKREEGPNGAIKTTLKARRIIVTKSRLLLPFSSSALRRFSRK